jgi:hypothetical protein
MTANSEAIGALARLACDTDREINRLRHSAGQYEMSYKTAIDAFWVEPEVSNLEVFRLIAIAHYERAHSLQLQIHRLKQRYRLCVEGINRFNSPHPSAPADAGDNP